jgi:hypothetical protein
MKTLIQKQKIFFEFYVQVFDKGYRDLITDLTGQQ